MRPKNSFVFSAAVVSRILGFEEVWPIDPMPQPSQENEVVLWYDQYTLQQLQKTPQGKIFMRQDQGFHTTLRSVETGYWRILFRQPGSRSLGFDQFVDRLPKPWMPAPVCVAVTAALLLLGDTPTCDPFDGEHVHVAEKNEYGRVLLSCSRAKLHISNDFGNLDESKFYWAAAQKC